MGREREVKGGAGVPGAWVGLSGTTCTSPQPPGQRVVSPGGQGIRLLAAGTARGPEVGLSLE